MVLDGGFFLALPGLCGDFRDILGGGEWSMAATGSLELSVVLFDALEIKLVVGEANVMASLGSKKGEPPREPCTTYGDGGTCATPAGIFFEGSLGTYNPWAGTIIESVFPGIEAEFHGYYLASQVHQPIPQAISANFAAAVGNIVSDLQQILKGLESTLKQIENGVGVAHRRLTASLAGIVDVCAGGDAQCWTTQEHFAEAAGAVYKAAVIVKALDPSVAGDAQHDAENLTPLLTKALNVLTDNLGSATDKLAATLVDLSDGFGFRGRVGLRLITPWFSYLGVRIEASYSRGNALKQCDKFKFVYEDLFSDFYKGTTTVVAKMKVVSFSGGSSSGSLAFDGLTNTAWLSGGSSNVPLYPNGAAGVVFRTWAITTMQALHVFTKSCISVPGCAAHISLARLEGGLWKTKLSHGLARKESGQWHSLPFENGDVEAGDFNIWKLTIEQQYVGKGQTVAAVPAPDGGYPRLADIRLVGQGAKHAFSAQLTFRADVPLGSFPLSLVTIKAGVYGQLVLGLGSKELKTSGTVESISNAATDGNVLLRLGIETSVLGIETDTTMIAAVLFDTESGKITGFFPTE